MPVAFRSPRPSRPIVSAVSALTSRTAVYVTRTYGGVGGGSCEAPPYPDMLITIFSYLYKNASDAKKA